jgi:beta-N-acetylhexosaminidase
MTTPAQAPRPIARQHVAPAFAAWQAATADAGLARMTLARKVGQVMMIGFDGTTLAPEPRAAVTDLHVGGVVLFERNVSSPEGLFRLISELQALALANGDPPLLIAIDQEGGRVARLREASGFTEFPSAMAVAATGDPDNARRMARAVALELVAVGINVNLAPDLDVNNNPDNPVIGIRSFGSDPATVAAFGSAFAEGLLAKGVLAVGKHFPGHGDVSVDSHIALPSVPHERARLESTELVPFRATMACPVRRPVVVAGERWGGDAIPGIMAAHITFPAIDLAPGLAATLSPTVLTGLLRDEMGYEGLIFTDSLDMGALAQSGYPAPVAAAAALAAGADVLLFNHGHELHRQAQALILHRIEHGQLPTSRLDAAVRRVLIAKSRFALPRGAGQERELKARVGTVEHKAWARQIAGQAITLLRDNACLLPLASDAGLLVVEPPDAAGLGQALGATTFPIEANPTGAQIRIAIGMAAGGRTVVVATTNARQNACQAQLVQALLAAQARLVVVAASGPYDPMAFPSAPTYLASYGANPPLREALVDVLRGRIKPRGRLPVELPGLCRIGAGLGNFVD